MRKKINKSYEIIINNRDAKDLKKEKLNVDDKNYTKLLIFQKTSLLKTLRIIIVDNFQITSSNCILLKRNIKLLQSKEIKIIIVLLIYNNFKNNYNFLKISNRINVFLK